MNAHQQKIVSEKIQKDTVFAQAYTNELAQKRQLRKHAIDVANQILNPPHVVGETRSSADSLISFAEKVYEFMTKDGDLSNLGVEPKIQLS